MSSSSGFRRLYQEAGPEGYYRAHGADYRNPHEPAVRSAIAYAVKEWLPLGLDLSHILDLAAGSGEATLALLTHVPKARVDACDPFTASLYEQRTGRQCHSTSFEQIALNEVELGCYSCVVVSCALHLAEESWLPPLCLALARATRHLLVITPLTRPEIRASWGWELVQAIGVEAEEKSVRMRWYRSGLAESA